MQKTSVAMFGKHGIAQHANCPRTLCMCTSPCPLNMCPIYLEWNYENLNESSLMFEQNSFISIPVNPISFIALSISETGTGTGQSN